MAEKKVTRADIVSALYDRTGISKGEIRTVVDLFIGEVKAALAQRCVIELRGFGTFEVRTRKARPRARNPRTGEAVSVRARGSVAFRPGRELRRDVWNVVDVESGAGEPSPEA